MNSKFFKTNTYGNIQTNPYLIPSSVRYQKQMITDATTTSYMNNTENDYASIHQTSRVNIRTQQNFFADGQIRQNNGMNYTHGYEQKKMLPIRYDNVSPQHNFQNNLVIQPLNFLNSTVKLEKNQHSRSGINLSNKSKTQRSLYGKTNPTENLETQRRKDQLKQMQHLAWKKCAINDNRCLGFNFQKQKQNQVTVCYKGHVKRNYL